jgi:hypothetical protein
MKGYFITWMFFRAFCSGLLALGERAIRGVIEGALLRFIRARLFSHLDCLFCLGSIWYWVFIRLRKGLDFMKANDEQMVIHE